MTDSPTSTPSADARESDADTKLPQEALDAWTNYEPPNFGSRHFVGTELKDAVRLRHAFMSGWIARRAVAPASTNPAVGAPSLMSAEELDGFDARARAATPGPWTVGVFDDDTEVRGAPDYEGRRWRIARTLQTGENSRHQQNSAHIRGLDPQTVLRLVARARLALGQAEKRDSLDAGWLHEDEHAARAAPAAMPDRDPAGRVRGLTEAAEQESDPTGWSKISRAAREASGLEQEALADLYNNWIGSLPHENQNPHQFKAFLAGAALVPSSRDWFAALEVAASIAERRKAHNVFEAIRAIIDIRGAASSVPREDGREDGWIVSNGNGTLFRTWGDAGPEWTTQAVDAVRYARRKDAERTHAEDEDARRIVRWPLTKETRR